MEVKPSAIMSCALRQHPIMQVPRRIKPAILPGAKGQSSLVSRLKLFEVFFAAEVRESPRVFLTQRLQDDISNIASSCKEPTSHSDFNKDFREKQAIMTRNHSIVAKCLWTRWVLGFRSYFSIDDLDGA
jgi:hypothetical protein